MLPLSPSALGCLLASPGRHWPRPTQDQPRAVLRSVSVAGRTDQVLKGRCCGAWRREQRQHDAHAGHDYAAEGS